MSLVIFLHGLGETPQTWQDQVTALPEGRSAVAPWLRGTRPGRSVGFEMDAAADDVLALVSAHGAESALLCGQGLGALVALVAATRAPDAVAALVLTGALAVPSRAALRAQAAVLRFTPSATWRARGVDKAQVLETLGRLARVDLAGRIATVRAPALLVAGADDAAGVRAAGELGRHLPDSRLEVVPGAGARVPQEAPAAFNALLYSFGAP